MLQGQNSFVSKNKPLKLMNFFVDFSIPTLFCNVAFKIEYLMFVAFSMSIGATIRY